MKTRSIALVIFLLSLLTAISIVPASAQDASATVEAMPIAIVTEEAAAPSIVCEDGATCNLNEAPDGNESGASGAPENSIPTPVVIVGGILFGIVFLGLLYNMERIAKIVAPLMSPEAAIAIVTAALPTIMDAVMNNVARAIPTDIDDHMFIEAARQRGLTVVRDDITGDYHTTRQAAAQASRPYPSVTGTPLTTDYTTSKTDTLPNRPSDGGASGGGTGFPPVR